MSDTRMDANNVHKSTEFTRHQVMDGMTPAENLAKMATHTDDLE